VRSVPAAAASGGITSNTITSNGYVATASATCNPDTEDSAGEPKDGREEAECDISFPFLARAFVGDVGPIEDATAVERTDESNEKTKSNKPADGDEKIDGPVDEAAGEREEPEEGEEHGESGDGLSVDEAAFGPGVVAQVLVGMEPLTGQASDDCCKGELANAEQHRDKRVCERCHCNGLIVRSEVVLRGCFSKFVGEGS